MSHGPRSNWHLLKAALLGEAGLSALFPKLVALTVILLSLAAIAGWAVFADSFRIRSPWIAQIHPLIATGMLLLAFALRLHNRKTLSRHITRLHFVFRMAAMGVGALAIFSAFSMAGQVPTGSFTMLHNALSLPSPTAGFCLVAFAMSLAVADLKKAVSFAQIMVGAAAMVSFCAVIADLYGVQPPAGLLRWSIDGPSGLLLFVIGVTLLFQLAHRGPLAVVHGDHAGGTVARRLIPASILVPILLGWMRMKAEQAGLVGPAAGLLIHVLISVAVMVGIVWRSALHLSRNASGSFRLPDRQQNVELPLRQLLDVMPYPTAIYDASGVVHFLNRSAQEYFSMNAMPMADLTMEALVGRQTWLNTFAPLLIGGGGARRPKRVVLECIHGSDLIADVEAIDLISSPNDVRIAVVLRPVAEDEAGKVILRRTFDVLDLPKELDLAGKLAG